MATTTVFSYLTKSISTYMSPSKTICNDNVVGVDLESTDIDLLSGRDDAEPSVSDLPDLAKLTLQDWADVEIELEKGHCLELVKQIMENDSGSECDQSNDDISKNDQSDEEENSAGIEYFEGTGQITNMVTGMADGLVDGQYYFNQLKFATCSLFLHDRVWIKAVKSKTCLDWRVIEMKLHKDSKEEEVEARQKFTLTHRKVKSVHSTKIVLEPLETMQGVASEEIRNTIAEVNLIPGDWLDVRTEETKGGVGSTYSLGSVSATLSDRQEVKGVITEVGFDGSGIYAVLDRCYYIPPSVWGCLELKVGSPVRAVVFRSEQKDSTFFFRAGIVKEDMTALNSIERRRIDELCSDKRGIQTIPHLCLDFGQLTLTSKKDASFTISNLGHSTHVLRNVKIQEDQTVAKFNITVTRESQEVVGVFVQAEYKILEVKITCVPLLIGSTTDFCIFDFGDFQIYKELRVKVMPNNKSLIQNLTTNRVSMKAHRRLNATEKKELARKHEPFTVPGKELVSAGIKLIRRPFFKAAIEKSKPYDIPASVQDATQNVAGLFENFPTLKTTQQEVEHVRVRKLTPENYQDMFHVALWMEEHHHLVRRQSQNLEDVVFFKSGESYFFDFPRLQDVFPKFHPNDPIRFVDRSDPKGKIYKANISRLGACQIFLDLKEDVFTNYDGRPLCVEFLLGRNSYKRCHHALDKMIENWGTNWLFQTEFTCLEPRIMFIEDIADGNHKEEVDPDGVSLLFRKRRPKLRARRFGTIIPRGGKRAASVFPVEDGSKVTSGGDPESPATVNMELKWANKTLNTEQKTAIRMILRGQARPCPYIIFGPPGTGKTVTVVEAVIQIYRLDPSSRILVCGPSNASANQIAMYLMEIGKLTPGEFIRFLGFNCDEGSIPELLKNYCMDGNAIQSVYMHRVVISTCNSAAQFFESYGLVADRFTHVFIDEAGYCHEPDSLIPIALLARNGEPPQIILAGDPNQLGPVVYDDCAFFHGLGTSLLERLMDTPLYQRDEDFKYPPLLITKLIRSYRAHRDLLSLPSRLFYDNELIPASKENLGELAERLGFLPKKGVPLLFHGVRGEQSRDSNSPSWYNPLEVVQVIHYVNLLLQNNCVPDDIGIISPYRMQVEKIKEALASEVKCRPIRVGTVEEFQGGEKKVIILSLVRSMDSDNENDLMMRLSFAFSPKRFNVSMTRAKCLLIGIGNPHVFVREYVWREFLKYAIRKEVYIGCDLPLILQAFMTKIARRATRLAEKVAKGIDENAAPRGIDESDDSEDYESSDEE